MKKRIIFVFLILIIIIAAAFALISRKGSIQTLPEDYKKQVDDAELLYNKAEEDIEKGRLLDAKDVYEKLLAEYPDSSLVKEVSSKLDVLNMEILFSPVPTADSIFYEVKPGDTLFKIANEFGTTIELIMKSNNLTNTVIMPDTRLKISKAKYSILIDKSQNILMLKADDEVLKTYIVSTGSNDKTPTGTYTIQNKLVDPTWYKAGAVVPPGSPENILGSRWMGLTLLGYGIHGTTDEATIGKHITEGCVRMRNRDVEELYSIVPVGTEVTIID